MSVLYAFNNGFPISSVVVPNAQLTSDVVLLPDDGFITITYSGSTISRWFKFVLNAISDVIVSAIINKSGGLTRYTDNLQDTAAATTLWVNDNILNQPGGLVWQNDNINFVTCRIDVIQDAATTPVVRSYRIRGDGRQSTLARQPGDIRLEVFRIA